MSPERFERITAMLNNRQVDLTVCLEMVHKSNNLAAIVRTADAVGVHQVHTIWPQKKMRISGHTATGSQKWVDIQAHTSTDEAIAQLRTQNMQIVVTHLSDASVDYRSIDYTKPTAILMGQEKHGITEEALEQADHQVIIPMVGMVQSLNVSVATALILYEAQQQRKKAQMYGACQLNEATCQRILFEGGYPIFSEVCRRKKLPYPLIDETGQIQAPESWWQALQQAK
tara:strand:- start:3757 stop:4440 length:684 start_codon:yes stop_codon:yes gene_type:complete